MTVAEPTTTWSNWAGNVTAAPQRVVRPGSVGEVQEVVREAAGRGDGVRVAGAGHSFSPLCATDGTLIDLSGLNGIESVDPETGDATVLAGTHVWELGQPLLALGRALANQGDIDRQALAGAVSTGTHGTGRKHGSFAAAVRALELVTADGEVRWVSTGGKRNALSVASSEEGGGDVTEFRAAALSLGMLGVITRVRLATAPAYKLREQTMPLPFEACLEEFPAIEAARRNAEFWWLPGHDLCVLKSFVETDDEPFTVTMPEYPPGTLERYLKPDSVDWGWKVYPSARTFPFVELEHTLPLAAGPVALRAIRELVRARYADMTWAVEYRTMAGEDPLLSPTQGAESVTISVHQAADLPYEAYFRGVEAICLEAGGRPHWGKLHWLDRDGVDRLYPGAEAFRAVRRGLDPSGVFLNGHLGALFG